MEGIDSLNVRLNNLGERAKKSTSAAFTLVTLFAEEARRLGREDEVSRLRASLSSVMQQVGMVKRDEDSASYGHTKANIVLSLGGLAAIGIGTVSKNKQISGIAKSLLQSTANNESVFGNVFICVGPKGIPGDVKAVSISRLARKSNRQEFEIIQELRERGYLLFNEEAFSALVDKLAEGVRKGQLSLPVSREKLLKITAPNQRNLKLKKIE